MYAYRLGPHITIRFEFNIGGHIQDPIYLIYDHRYTLKHEVAINEVQCHSFTVLVISMLLEYLINVYYPNVLTCTVCILERQIYVYIHAEATYSGLIGIV